MITKIGQIVHLIVEVEFKPDSGLVPTPLQLMVVQIVLGRQQKLKTATRNTVQVRPFHFSFPFMVLIVQILRLVDDLGGSFFSEKVRSKFSRINRNRNIAIKILSIIVWFLTHVVICLTRTYRGRFRPSMFARVSSCKLLMQVGKLRSPYGQGIKTE